MLTGADTIDELKLIRDETIQLLKLGAFELSKRASNCPELVQIEIRDRVPVIIRDNATNSCILGMQWNQCQDTFQFLCKLDTGTHVVSKRVIHSRQARYQRPSLQVTVLKISYRSAQDRLATAIRAIGRLTIGALNQQG